MADDPIDARLAMLRRVGGDRLISALIDLMLESTPHKLEAARAALMAGDADEVRRLAHSLGSSAGNLGATEMQQACYDLEHNPDGRRTLAELLRRVDSSWARARNLLYAKKRGLRP